MIEIEIKYAALPAAVERIRKEGTFLKERRMENVYYDSPDWQLTCACLWLRTRDGKWELKVPVEGVPMGSAFHERETDKEILAHFGWPANASLSQQIAEHGFTPFVTIQTVREQWTWNGVHVDIDASTYQNGAQYTVLELEMMADAEIEVPAVRARIEQMASELGLQGGEVMGKVMWYIHAFSPAHFQALVDSGCWVG